MIQALAVVLALLSGSVAHVEPIGTATIRVTPNPLPVTTFFNGAELQIVGEAPDGMALAVLLTSVDGDVELEKKGKVWGVLWMKIGEADIRNVPGAYLLASSVSLTELAPVAVRQANGIGLDVLAASRGITGDGEEPEVWEELVKLKKHERLYGTFESCVTIQAGQPGRVDYTTVLPVPARFSEGSYRVALWGFHDARAQLLAATELTVHTVGVIHDIAALARNHGLLYGVGALIIALVVGLATGVVVGLAGKGGH
jgi:hypothetical protein